ncbi:Uncharacterised protein [Mycobacteroides abscessus]|nr:Uncharacterised protein [Mycobacteroides abscessus]
MDSSSGIQRGSPIMRGTRSSAIAYASRCSRRFAYTSTSARVMRVSSVMCPSPLW